MSVELPADAEAVQTPEEIEAILGDLVIGRDDHENAPGFVIKPDTVVYALDRLREQAGFDHLSCVTAQEYADRYESIYHLTSYGDRTKEVSIVVPTDKENPVSQSANEVFRTADWHEREAYDLVGIEYDE
ncbi:MAG: NADH-quinone oxidoreductase subunit C, partial [Halonotius sp.]